MRYKASDFLEAIPGTGGIKTQIARRVGCDRKTLDTALGHYPTVKAAYDAECETMLDVAESVVYGNIHAAARLQRQTGGEFQADSTDAKWYLSKKGKHRGYVERQEVTGKDGENIVIEFRWNDADDYDLDEEAA